MVHVLYVVTTDVSGDEHHFMEVNHCASSGERGISFMLYQ